MARCPGVAALSLALAAIGCFPDYSVREQDWLPPGMLFVGTEGESLVFDFHPVVDSTDQMPYLVSMNFTRDFALDADEVTVGRFKQWLAAGMPLPCNDGNEPCPLDPGGPYDMTWDPAWKGTARIQEYADPPCNAPKFPYNGTTTFAYGNADYPMTCVSWPQAVAFCAWEGKRLPTESEWVFAARGIEVSRDYPWGSEPPNCERATIENCTYPTHIRSAPLGDTPDGAHDMAGSVFEWVWDVSWSSALAPHDATNYSGPGRAVGPSSLTQPHLRNGGAFISWSADSRLRTDRAEIEFRAELSFADAGFRCAHSGP